MPPQIFRDPIIILIFGPGGAGKSTVGRLAAERLPKCAYIEVDALRYMVAGGLVAYSRGIHPGDAPEAYKEQCWMAVENSVCLTHGFAAHGFSSVIEGLEDECRPDNDWAARVFETLPVFNVALLCDKDELVQRWQLRGWSKQLTRQVRDDLHWYRSHRELFDCVLDTTQNTPEQSADILFQCLSTLMERP